MPDSSSACYANPQANINIVFEKTDQSDLHFINGFGSSENRSLHSTLHSIARMLGSTVIEVRSWAMPALFQDLATLLSSEPTPQDITEDSLPTSLPSATRPSDVGTLPRESESSSRRLQESGKRRAKLKTKFVLAHAPPITRSKQRLSTRPRTVLQLQRVSDTPRPLPAFDVISSTALASRLTRTVPKLVSGEKWANADTLILLRSEMYGQDPAANSDASDDSGNETIHRRASLGSICYSRDGDEICLENGLIWEAARLKVGVYEFSGKNHHGLKVRWVLRRASKTSANPGSPSRVAEPLQSSRFTFSIINPNTRRHPVIATLTSDNELDILDRFPTSISSAKGSELGSNPQSPVTSEFSSETAYFDRPRDDGSSYIQTDENLRILIILTAIWVMSKEGWSGSLSRSSMATKSRRENTNGSPSAVVSNIGGVLGGSPSDSRRSFHLDRSSTSLFSQRTGLKQLALHRRAHSADSSSMRRETVNASRSASRNTLLLPSALCCGQEQVERSRCTTDENIYRALASFDAECIRDNTLLPENDYLDDAEEPSQAFAKIRPSAVTECHLDDGSAHEGPDNEESRTDETKQRPRRWRRLLTSVKTIASPCIGSV